MSHSHCRTCLCSAKAAGTVWVNSKQICLGGGLTPTLFLVSRHPEGCQRMPSCKKKSLMHSYKIALQSHCLATVASQGSCSHSLTDGQEIPIFPVSSLKSVMNPSVSHEILIECCKEKWNLQYLVSRGMQSPGASLNSAHVQFTGKWNVSTPHSSSFSSNSLWSHYVKSASSLTSFATFPQAIV